MGKGNNIRFWEDIWVGDSSLASRFPRLYSVSCNNNALISSLVSWNSCDSFSWDLQFCRNFIDREVGEFSNLMDIVCNARLIRIESDSRSWMGEKSGLFSCKSFFHMLINFLGDCNFVPHNIIRKVGIPPKVKIFAWLASWKRVNTCDLLQKRRSNLAISPSWCILCKNGEESILLHNVLKNEQFIRVEGGGRVQP